MLACGNFGGTVGDAAGAFASLTQTSTGPCTLSGYPTTQNGFVLEGSWFTQAATAPSGTHGAANQYYRLRVGTTAMGVHSTAVTDIGAYPGSGTLTDGAGTANLGGTGAGNTVVIFRPVVSTDVIVASYELYGGGGVQSDLRIHLVNSAVGIDVITPSIPNAANRPTVGGK